MAKEVAELKEEAQIFKQGHLRSETLFMKAFRLSSLHKIIIVLKKFTLRPIQLQQLYTVNVSWC